MTRVGRTALTHFFFDVFTGYPDALPAKIEERIYRYFT
jgi:hypothetical protein